MPGGTELESPVLPAENDDKPEESGADNGGDREELSIEEWLATDFPDDKETQEFSNEMWF